MKFSTVVLTVATFATAAFAQLDQFPPCGQTCLVSNIGSAGCTGIDIPCICNSKPFFDKVVPCIESGCASQADQDKSVAAAIGLCKASNPNVGDWLPKPPTTTQPPTEPTPTNKPSPCKPKLRFARNL
ncbi:hypothetical protein TWF730_005975 [Orbilia blumenaviensis]|uniref:CFEM domain-containing protein n=1 Tax=Orbilia blumenaviensis TaxID=1796055 RepID=A0AAV9VM69_9PEZI